MHFSYVTQSATRDLKVRLAVVAIVPFLVVAVIEHVEAAAAFHAGLEGATCVVVCVVPVVVHVSIKPHRH